MIIPRLRRRRNQRALLTAAGCLLFVGTLAPTTVQASVPILSFAAIPSTTQAGGHPDFNVEFSLSTHQNVLDPCDCKDAKNIDVHLPAGLIGNPHATPQCDVARFASDQCPVDSQVGIALAEVAQGPGNTPGHSSGFITPVYNLIPPPTQPGLLGFKSGLFDTPTFENVSARTNSDYGLDVDADSIEHFFPIDSFEQVTWGVPADPIHDFARFGFRQPPQALITLFAGRNPAFFCDQSGVPSTADPASVFQICSFEPGGQARPVGALEAGPGGPVSSNSPLTPFLQNPTTCGLTSLQTSMDVLSYDGGATHADSSWPATTDCDQLSFNPSQAIAPTTEEADSPSGAEFRLTVPQFESPSVPSPSELRAATVTLPPGFALAPNVMNGKTTCSDAEARFGTTEEAQCPEFSKIGTIFVDTPVLPGRLFGAVYLGEPKPGNRFRIILAFDGFGVHVKLPGTVIPDPAAGQIQISFADLPQAPFETFNMHVFGSERGPLATPTSCGTDEVQSVFSPWDSSLSSETSRQFFTIDQGPNEQPCPGSIRPLDPSFTGGVTDSAAAAHTTFALNLTRNDGDQNLAGLTLTTPPGFSATLKGIPYCPQAAIDQLANPLYPGASELAAPLCAASQIGTVTVGVGAGSHPLYLPGRVYLAGPYKGAPLSLEVVIPAVSGPYDLGNVAVRAAIHVDPTTAQITTVSDQLPQIVGGIPIRTRQILVNLDRPNFALNPTDCDPFSISADLTGDQGTLANLRSNFQVANCASLPFAPKLALKLTGSTRQAGNPALTATLTAKPGEANISRAQVTLPPTELVDNAHIKNLCTRVQFNEGKIPGEKCSPGSILGFAKADTPLLEQPLEGPIYLRATGRAGLPDVVAALNGQIDIVLDGHVDSVHGRLRTTFETVPDAPVTKVVLSFDGGHKGIIENSPQLCAHAQHFTASITGQNGKTANRNPVLSAPCGKKHKRKARAHRNRSAHR